MSGTLDILARISQTGTSPYRLVNANDVDLTQGTDGTPFNSASAVTVNGTTSFNLPVAEANRLNPGDIVTGSGISTTITVVSIGAENSGNKPITVSANMPDDSITLTFTPVIDNSDLLLIDDVSQAYTFEGNSIASGGGGQASTKKVTFAQVLNYINNNVSVSYSNVTGTPSIPTVPTLLDSDTMAGALSTNIASAESIKAYVDAEVAGVNLTATNLSISSSTDRTLTIPSNSSFSFASADSPPINIFKITGSDNIISNTCSSFDIKGIGSSAPGKIRIFDNNGSNSIAIKGPSNATSDKTLTLPDSTGTIALTSDITGTNSNTNTGDVTLHSSIQDVLSIPSNTQEIRAIVTPSNDTIIGFDSSENKITHLSQADALAVLGNPLTSLPTASSSTKGGVKVGTGLGISSEVLSVNIDGISTTMTGVSNDDKIIIHDNGSSSIQKLRLDTLKTYVLIAGATEFYSRDDQSIEGDTDENFTMLSHRDLIFHTNKDGDASSNFKFLHGSNNGTEVAKITNAGNLEILGDLQVKGDNIKGNSNSNGISFDSSGNTTIAGDLAISGNVTGTVNVTGNVTGNVTLPSSGSLTLPTASTIQDSSGDKIIAPKTRNVGGTNKTFTQVTNLEIEGSSEGRIFGPTDNDLIIRSEKNLIFQVDADNDSTNNFTFKDGGDNTIASLTEAGVLTLNSALPIASGGTGISSVSGNANRFLKVNSSANAFELVDPTELVQDIAGPLVATGGTKTGISITYDDTNNNMDFVVSDLTVAGDSGSTGMTPGDTLTIAGGSNVTTSMSGDTLTISASSSSSSGLTLTPSSASDPAAGVNSAIIIKEGNTSTVAGKVYYLAPNGTWVLANAGAEGTRSGLLGVAVDSNSTTHGMVVKGVVVMSGHSGSAGNGKTIYLDTTDGAVTTSAPSSVRILGSIISHNSSRCEIYFNPDNFNGQASNPVSSSFTATKSYSLDGINDYAYATNMSGISTWGKNAGTYSAWVNLDNSNAANTTYNTRYLFFWKEDDNHNNFIGLHLLEVTSSTFALVHRYRHGSTTRYSTVFMQNTNNHGFPFHRSANGFGTNEQRNWTAAGADGVDRVGHDAWIHIAVTWNTTDTYTYNGNTYTGRTKLYLNGELRNVGQGNGVPGFNQQATAIGLSARPNADDDFSQLYVGSLSSTLPRINMYIKDLAMWSTELDADAIAYISDKNSSTEPASVDLGTASGNYTTTFKNALVGWWQFENNGNDSSDNNNNLTFVGETESQFISNVPGE